MEYLKRAEVCRKQFALQKKMDEGDSDITVCFKCERLFKQDMAPCTHCRGCRQFLPEGQALAHKKLYKEFNRIYGCSAKKAAEINSRRAVMIHQIRKTMPEIPRIAEPDPGRDHSPCDGLIRRNCLRCGGSFKTDSKYVRLCPEHRNANQGLGFEGETHYYIRGGFDA